MTIDTITNLEFERFKRENRVVHNVFQDYINEPNKDVDNIKNFANFILRYKSYVPEMVMDRYVKMYFDKKPVEHPNQMYLFE